MHDRDRVIRERKQRIARMVRERFDRHGEEVVAVVFAAALQPSKTRDLAGRLGMEPPRGLEPFLDAVAGLVRSKGPGAILTVARVTGRGARDASLEEKFRRIVAFAESSAVEPAVSGVPAMRGSALPSSRGMIAPPARPASLPPERSVPPAATLPQLPREEFRLPEAEPEAATQEVLPWIRVPGYEGPERRRIHERRFHPDRRRQAAAIDRNRRFGGDRRQITRGRRAEDGTRPSHWWRYIGDHDQERVLPFLHGLGPPDGR